VNDCHDVGPRLIGFAVDKMFEKQRSAFSVDGFGIEVVFHDVRRSYQGRCEKARHQVTLRVVRIAHANVAEPIEDTFIGKNRVSRYEIFDNRHSLTVDCCLVSTFAVKGRDR
jgi:hypothetical protein